MGVQVPPPAPLKQAASLIKLSELIHRLFWHIAIKLENWEIQSMEIKLSLNEGLDREFKIEINASDIDERLANKLIELAKSVKMPGFRPGKVPLSVVKARYGDQSKGEVIQTMLDEAARKAIESNELNLASQPALDITSYEDGKDLEASLKCEVLPEIDLPDISGLTIERPILPIDETEVQNTMQRLASENSPTEKAKTNYKAALGDVVVIDFEGSIDNVPFDGGAAKGHSLELGSNTFIPGFEDGLVGMKAGDEKDIDVMFPENYQASHLAGKKANFSVKVDEVRTKGKPVLDDSLAEKLGFKNLSLLDDAVRGQINSQHSPALRQLLKKNILDQLYEYAKFDVPKTLLSSEYDVVAKSMKSEQGIDEEKSEGGEQPESKNADEGLDEATKKEALSISTRRVRLGLMLTEIGRVNELKVSEEDTKRAIFEQAKNYPGQENQVIEYYQKNPNATQQLAGPLFEDKVIDYILELANVTDAEISIDELYDTQEVSENKKVSKTAKKKTKAKSKKVINKSNNLSVKNKVETRNVENKSKSSSKKKKITKNK